jgi:hypothetical protein
MGGQRMSEPSASLVTELAKALILSLQERVPEWQRAYVRFEASEDQHRVNGSYVTASGTSIFDVFEFKGLLVQVRSLGLVLRDALTHNGEKFCVFLLSVDSNFNFDVDYEWKDPTRWQITKLGGASGLPKGVAGA